MNTIFINSANNKAPDPRRLLLNLSDQINLKKSNRQIVLSNLSIYYIWNIIKKLYKNGKFKTPAPK